MSETTEMLSVAVDKLARDREVDTIFTDEKTGNWLGVHTETHPPLLTLLVEGTGFSNGPKSAETPLPIDADALEIWGQVHDLIRLWCKQLRIDFTDDLIESVLAWHKAHNALARTGVISEATQADVSRMVAGWVRMIEQKFEPDKRREWTDHCIQCSARRIVLKGSEVFAIELNVTTRTAACRACGTEWVGEDALKELRYLTNLDNENRANLLADTPV